MTSSTAKIISHWEEAQQFSDEGRFHDAILQFEHSKYMLLEDVDKNKEGDKISEIATQLLNQINKELEDHYSLLRGNLFIALGVRKNCSAKHVKKAFKYLAIKYHPDRNVTIIANTTELFQIGQTAYEVLLDDIENKTYIPTVVVGDWLKKRSKESEKANHHYKKTYNKKKVEKHHSHHTSNDQSKNINLPSVGVNGSNNSSRSSSSSSSRNGSSSNNNNNNNNNNSEKKSVSTDKRHHKHHHRHHHKHHKSEVLEGIQKSDSVISNHSKHNNNKHDHETVTETVVEDDSINIKNVEDGMKNIHLKKNDNEKDIENINDNDNIDFVEKSLNKEILKEVVDDQTCKEEEEEMNKSSTLDYPIIENTEKPWGKPILIDNDDDDVDENENNDEDKEGVKRKQKILSTEINIGSESESDNDEDDEDDWDFAFDLSNMRWGSNDDHMLDDYCDEDEELTVGLGHLPTIRGADVCGDDINEGVVGLHIHDMKGGGLISSSSSSKKHSSSAHEINWNDVLSPTKHNVKEEEDSFRKKASSSLPNLFAK